MSEKILPHWAPRLPKESLQTLYESDANGIIDEALIDEVGYTLLARCQSFLTANEAVEGRASCAVCGTVVLHSGDKDEELHCQACGWTLSWGDYFSTIQRKQLSGADPVRTLFRTFIERFPNASSPRKKMVQIDQLIHGFHWHMTHGPTRPVAVNLLDGRLRDVIVFLDELTYGPASTPGMDTVHDEWIDNSRYVRSWSRS